MLDVFNCGCGCYGGGGGCRGRCECARSTLHAPRSTLHAFTLSTDLHGREGLVLILELCRHRLASLLGSGVVRVIALQVLRGKVVRRAARA